MTREAFLTALRSHLRGMPPQTVNDLIADYASHFDEGLAAGRSEAQIVAALGDPARLARELRAEIGLKRWDEERSPSAAAAALFAILGLGAIDVLLLPLLLVVSCVILAFVIVAAALVVAGLAVLASSPFSLLHGVRSVAARLLTGAGLLSGGVALAALQALLVTGLTGLLMRYGRFHLRLIRPASPAAESLP